MSLKRAPRQRVELRLRRSAVQYALAIDEILRMITLQLRGDSASLLALATTCKTWSAVALDELWTEISSQQLTRISSIRSECISSNRPDIYSESLRKAQVLINVASPRETTDVWPALPTFRPHTIICLDSSRPIQTSVLAPHTTALVFAHDRGIWDAVWLANFSRDLHNVASSLKVLEIALVPRPASMKVLSDLSDLRVLRKLKLQLTDDCAYSWLQQPSLNDEPYCGSLSTSEGKGLHALEELDIEAPIPVVRSILALTGSKLRNIRITGAPFDSATAISGLFAQISQGPWTTGITHLRYGISNRWPIVGGWDDSLEEWGIAHLERDTVLITSQHLQSLLGLNSLSHLALTFHTRPRLDDSFFGSLVHKLPLLQNLSISGRDRDHDTYPLVTLGSVLVLAQLPFLSALSLPLDVRVDTGTTVVVEQHFNSLTRLCLSDISAPTEYGAIIPILATLFPKLRKVYIPEPLYEDPRHSGWLSLWDTWESCQTALGIDNARSLEIGQASGLEEDFFVAAVADSIGIDEAENDSVDYFNSSVDLDEYYTRFPEARGQPFEIDNVIYATPQDLFT